MENSKEFEKIEQKIKLKELNNMNTLNEYVDAAELVADEMNIVFTVDDIKAIREKMAEERERLMNDIGELPPFPLAAIEKMAHIYEKISKAVCENPSDNDLSYLGHLGEVISSTSHKLVKDGVSVPSDEEVSFYYTPEAISKMDDSEFKSLWLSYVEKTIKRLNMAISARDNIKICDYCYNLDNLAATACIFF